MVFLTKDQAPEQSVHPFFQSNTKQTIMNEIKEKIDELNHLILQGKVMEGFEKFYHEDVIMQENELPPTVGKGANRTRELEFHNNITELREEQVLEVAIGDNVSMVVWQYDFTHKQWGARRYKQVSVQHWRDGLIVKEQFFYGS